MLESDLEPDVQNVARSEIKSQSLSAAKAKSVLGWEARWDLERGLRETVEWYRSFLARS